MCFEYASDYDLSEEQQEDLYYFITKMDDEFLPWWKKKQPKPRAPKGGKRGTHTEGSS